MDLFEQKTNKVSLRQKVYAQIKRDIITCKLKPGEPLSENQFVEEFEVSKTPIREALTSLQQDHLVEYVANRGFRVAPISVQDVQEIFDARKFYEVAMFRLALKRITPADIEKLESYSRLKIDPGLPDSVDHVLDANLNFHIYLAKVAGNSRLNWHYAHLLDEAQRLIYLDFNNNNNLPMWQHSHQDLLNALRNRDEAAGVRAIEESLDLAKRRILRAE